MILFTEILLDILELIHDDVETLKTLALTSSIFRDLCQQQLFQCVNLRNVIIAKYNSAVPPAFLVQFHDVVTKNPRIASYVREIRLAQHSIPPTGGLRYRRPGVPMLWMLDKPTLIVEVLDALSSSPIHTLAFVSRKVINWTDLHEGFRRSFLEILRNPSFKKISLDGLDIPHHFFCDFTTLQSVNLRSVEVHVGSGDILPVTRLQQISQLVYNVPYRHRDYNNPNSQIHCIGPIIGLDLSSLQSLTLDFDLSQVARLTHLLQLPKITSLDVSTVPFANDPDPWHPTPTQPLDLSGLPKLTNLVLCNNTSGSADQFEWVGNALESLTMPQRQKLESVTMILITTSDTTGKAATFDFMTPLARHLSRLHQCSERIQRILVHLKVAWGNDPNALSQLQQGILQHLSMDWHGCEDVLDVKVENNLEWLYRNRSAW
ncbi:hypothetical protein BDN72DRAFT_850861 [Pluteus cervinus]|uniref:Uncharacterized protein n=1 Tax=Pluteus cervinus TaxID=181527 RepID=A0ACD3A358_9AGAR|nr:hypothetical protein BDN72DRAFT_850861 [Pluteus cervinus]